MELQEINDEVRAVKIHDNSRSDVWAHILGACFRVTLRCISAGEP